MFKDGHENLRKVAIFPNDDNGRVLLAQFQETNRILRIHAGYMEIAPQQQPTTGYDQPQGGYQRKTWNRNKPCILVEYIPGLDTFIEQKEDDVKPVRKGVKTGSS